ncbi:MAG: hypothetical protein H0U70_00975, partial [Tatlockia sp.]|nr:hypothetical protein [Tatlockia sp.]
TLSIKELDFKKSTIHPDKINLDSKLIFKEEPLKQVSETNKTQLSTNPYSTLKNLSFFPNLTSIKEEIEDVYDFPLDVD